MVFSSLIFIFRFMPLAFLLYYLTPRKYKNFSLFLLSLIFYSWGEIHYIPVLFLAIIVNFYISNKIEKKFNNKRLCKLLLSISMITNLGILGLFKYSDFFIDNINNLFNVSISNLELALPLGISFYTFQIMSYSIDVYRGKVKAEKNFIDFGAFVALFPQLIAGPIVRYTDINKELKNRKVDFDQIRDGIELFIFGLASKVLIANAIGSLWDEASELGFSNISSPLAWLSILAFTFQIYFDFSGYSLMAIGLGKMLGFNFPKNFNYPYISKSMTEFWRRWHITLGSWFREYLYIPLGGNRKGTLRHYFNLFFVWAVTGFWHGASWNFVFWGLLFFILISLEKLFLLNILEGKHLLSKIFSRVYFIILTMIGWAVFAITDFNDLQLFFSRLFAFDIGTDVVYYIRNYFMVFILAGVFSTPILKKPWEHLNKNGAVRTIILLVLFIITVAYIVDSSYNPFLYFRF